MAMKKIYRTKVTKFKAVTVLNSSIFFIYRIRENFGDTVDAVRWNNSILPSYQNTESGLLFNRFQMYIMSTTNRWYWLFYDNY